MTPYHIRESQRQIVARCLAIVDPLITIGAGLWLALQLRPIAESWIQHHPLHYLARAVALYVGVVLVAANPMMPISLLARGIGISTEIFGNVRLRPIAFWTGIALVSVSHYMSAMQWIDREDPLPDYTGTAILTIIAGLGIFLGAADLVRATFATLREAATSSLRQAKNRSRWRNHTGQITLCGGMAKGVFRDRNLANGAPRKGEVLLYGERIANRGTIAIGAPGSSKTRCKIYPDLYWGLLTSPRAGALIFVTKRRATNDFLTIARAFRTGAQTHVVGIGEGRATMDITAGMTHEAIGDAIRDGIGQSQSDFWKHGPAAFVEGLVELIQALAPAMIRVEAARDKDGNVDPGGDAYDLEIGDTLPTLLRLISLDGRRLDAVFGYGFDRAMRIASEDSAKAEDLRTLLHGIKERLVPLLQRDMKLGEEFRQSVLPQIQPFGRGSVREAFCDHAGIDLSLIERGHVIILEIDETEHPRAVGTIVRMVFRRIALMARQRTASHRIGSLDPILLICDEYTNYAAPGHAQIWNTIRESNFCATVGITSVSALAEQLGNASTANSIVGNFANKLFFESDDKTTRDLANELVGKSTVVRRGTSEGSSKTRSTSANASISGGGSHQSRGTTHSTSTSEQREDALDGSVWRSLHAEKEHATAIAFVRTEEGTTTDVVTLGVLDPAERIATAVPEEYGLR
jgi:hypothetical protein